MDDPRTPSAPESDLLVFPSRIRRLRALAQARRTALVVLPLGAFIGTVAALALKGLEALQDALRGQVWHGLALLLLPLVGLTLTGLWLRYSGLGDVSLVKDLARARTHPYEAFAPWPSLGKGLACALTIGFGGSAGIEGPAKWLGAAAGLQVHTALRALATRLAVFRRVIAQPQVIMTSGAAAALAAVFRAPLSGALLAAEHEGELSASEAAPAFVASAAGYLSFIALRGPAPLLGAPATYHLVPRELLWAIPLGVACALGATLFRRLLRVGRGSLRAVPLPLRGLLAGLGLVLLALPAHRIWPGLPVTQGGGLDLIGDLLKGHTPATAALGMLTLKLLATALTFAGCGVGGTWLPTLAMGAALGAVFDAWAGLGQPGLFALVGASAFTGAVHRTLLVPVVFLAETTGQAALVVPSLVATVIAFEATREG